MRSEVENGLFVFEFAVKRSGQDETKTMRMYCVGCGVVEIDVVIAVGISYEHRHDLDWTYCTGLTSEVRGEVCLSGYTPEWKVD